MINTMHGKVHGRNIELDEDPGVADGQEVEVQMKLVQPTRKWGEGILRTAGALADDPDWDLIMEEIHNAQDRTSSARGVRMTHLLDTNICSAHMRRPSGLAHCFFQYAGGIAIPTVVLAELYAGAYKHPNPPKLLGLIADLLQEVAVLDFDSACAEQYGKVQGGLLQQGITISVADLMIGAVALVHDLTLVTHNTADFQNIPGLRLADWLNP